MIIQAVRRVSLCVFLACLAVGTAHARFPGTGVVNGLISAVGSGPPPAVTIGGVTVNVTDQTVIQVGGGPGTVDDLVAGAHARATFEVSTHNALQIVVRDHPPARLDGRIDAIDAGATPPTVTIAGTTLKVMPGTRIRVAGVPGTLDDLIVGEPAHATYDPHTLIAFAIEVRPKGSSVAVGRVLSVDLGAGRVALDVNGNGAADFSFSLNAQTRASVAQALLAPAQFGLLVGLKALVSYDATNAVAFDIHAFEQRATHDSGKVSALDPNAGTLSIQTAAGGLDFQIAAGAKITLNGHPASLADLQLGDTATVHAVLNGNHVLIGTRVAAYRDAP